MKYRIRRVSDGKTKDRFYVQQKCLLFWFDLCTMHKHGILVRKYFDSIEDARRACIIPAKIVDEIVEYIPPKEESKSPTASLYD